MKSSTILLLSLAAVIMFADSQNGDTIRTIFYPEVKTRDNRRAYLRQKRQFFMLEALSLPQTPVTEILVTRVAMPVRASIRQEPNCGCFWSGTAPFCSSLCGKNFHAILTDIRGDGKKCWTGHKKRCCPIHSSMVMGGGEFSS